MLVSTAVMSPGLSGLIIYTISGPVSGQTVQLYRETLLTKPVVSPGTIMDDTHPRSTASEQSRFGDGVGVGVLVGRGVQVLNGVLVGVGDGVSVGVFVNVGVGVNHVPVGEGVGVFVIVAVGVLVGVDKGVSVGVGVGAQFMVTSSL
jgi:hypothetical protein